MTREGLASRSTSSGRFAWTGAFRIWAEYYHSGNELIPSYLPTERENGSQEWNRSILFHLISQPNRPLQILAK